MLEAKGEDVERDVAAIIDRPLSALHGMDSISLPEIGSQMAEQDEEAEEQDEEAEEQDEEAELDKDPPEVQAVSSLRSLGSANLQLVNDSLNLQSKDKKEKEIDPLDIMRPSSKIRMFKSKMNLKMSNINLNQVLPIEYPKPFEVLWSKINYKVRTLIRPSGMMGPVKLGWREILNDISGYVRSGEITAIMGPSGAGKSSLLEIIAGRRKTGSITGHIGVRHSNLIRLAYVPQDNHLMGTLNVEETLHFACRIQNLNQADSEVNKRVSKIIEMFGLDVIRETFIERCSGGQQKRISIACELFSKPNVLILDEPTTGLDSPSCATVTKLLRELVDNPHHQIAVIATIHQPPWSVFTNFHRIYILSKAGSPLYLGTPTNLLRRLQDVGYPCGKYDSPADHVIEIAAGDYGDEPVKKMVFEHQQSMIRPQSPICNTDDSLRLHDILVKRKAPLARSFPILLNRSWRIYYRHMGINGIRIISIFAITIWLCALFGTEVGKISGCPLKKLELYAIPVEKLSNLFEESILMVSQNACALFFGLMVGLISGMVSTVLEFPREMRILNKEYGNGWYQASGFYIIKTILDIPMQLIVPTIYVSIMYVWTNQPWQPWRAGTLWYITIAVTFCAESVGAMSAAVFMENPMAAAFIAAAIPLPMCMFGGLIVKYSRMPWYMQIASWSSLLKYAFEGIIITMYGYDRCDFTYQEFLRNTNVSAIEKPAWAQYMPLIIDVLETNPHVETGFETPDPSVDADEEFLKKIYAIAFSVLSGDTEEEKEQIKQGNSFDFNRSLILSYFELFNDDILPINIIVMTLYYFGLKILTYMIVLAKLRRS